MQFHELNTKLNKHFEAMCQGTTSLFEVAIDPDYLWEVYLDSFPPEMNRIFRKRREFDCSCCRNFVKRFGNVVRINDNFEITTIWDFQINHEGYQQVLNNMSSAVREYAINGAYISKERTQGTQMSLDMSGQEVITWNHFFLEIPAKFQYKGRETLDTERANVRTTSEVLKRSLEELKPEAMQTVIEMVEESILYRGEEWMRNVIEFRDMQRKYLSLIPSKRNNYLWKMAVTAPGVITRIRNHSIGTLLIDLSAGMEMDAAIARWNNVMAPTNYKQPKGVFSKRQVEDAQRKIEELGYQDSLARRFANLADVKVSDVLFADRNAKKHMGGLGGIMAILKEQVEESPAQFKGATPITIEDFLAQLSEVENLEVFFENQHQGNLVSLIAPVKTDAMSMFKWGNNFSWAYANNATDSDMKKLVNLAGGKTDGVLRASLQWEHQSDLDLHCTGPNGFHIYFGDKIDRRSNGNLDVDIIHPTPGKSSVENINFPELNKMPDGIYQFNINCYNERSGDNGFKAEIEFGGQLFQFEHNKRMYSGQTVAVARVHLVSGNMTLDPVLKPTSSSISTEAWGMRTNRFQKVSLMCYSPNYWGPEGTGNKHYMFMLTNCKNPDTPNGFFNEYLYNDLNAHRQVFAALGKLMKVEPSDDQLSGLGFSSTQRASLIVRINNQRIYKIVF